jgi:toxin HigB-1
MIWARWALSILFILSIMRSKTGLSTLIFTLSGKMGCLCFQDVLNQSHATGIFMEVEFADESLSRLEREFQFAGGFPPEVVRAFRKKLWFIRQAMDERDFYHSKGLRFEKLKGSRSHQRSMRLNDQWRLIIEIRDGTEKNIANIVSVEDYH